MTSGEAGIALLFVVAQGARLSSIVSPMLARLQLLLKVGLVAALLIVSALSLGIALWHRPTKISGASAEMRRAAVRELRASLRHQVPGLLRDHHFRAAWWFAASGLGIRAQRVLENADGSCRVEFNKGGAFVMRKDGTNWTCVGADWR